MVFIIPVTMRLSGAGGKPISMIFLPEWTGVSNQWIHYREPSSYLAIVKIEDDKKQKAKFEAPKVKKEETVHIILNVRDTGKPELTLYQRIIVTVMP